MFLERFKEVENFTITKLPLGGSKNFYFFIPFYATWLLHQCPHILLFERHVLGLLCVTRAIPPQVLVGSASSVPLAVLLLSPSLFEGAREVYFASPCARIEIRFPPLTHYTGLPCRLSDYIEYFRRACGLLFLSSY